MSLMVMLKMSVQAKRWTVEAKAKSITLGVEAPHGRGQHHWHHRPASSPLTMFIERLVNRPLETSLALTILAHKNYLENTIESEHKNVLIFLHSQKTFKIAYTAEAEVSLITTGVRHNKTRHTPHCRVLLPGEFDSIS